MRFGAVGDLHGAFDALDLIMRRHPEIGLWLCPGDLANDAGEYPSPIAPLYWIKGNNEDFDFVAAQPPASGTIPNLHFLPNGVAVTAFGLSLAGLGGTFAPTWYETPAAELPPGRAGRGALASEEKKSRGAARGGGAPASDAAEAGRGAPASAQEKSRGAARGEGVPASDAAGAGRGAPATKDDKRRHFVHEEVEACKSLRGIDVFLSHEAARPFLLDPRRGPGPARRIDAGKTPINEVLAAMQPRLHLFGHHHQYRVEERQKVTSIGLELVTESYVIFDGKSLAHQRFKTYSP